MKIAVIGTGNVGRALGPADVVVLALPWICLANPAQLRQKHRLSIATTLR